jgi:hypothetical protein
MGSWCFGDLPLLGRNGLDELASRMADGFRGDRARWDSTTLIAMVAGTTAIILLLWIVSRYVGRQDRRTVHQSPGKLFLRLCSAHRLTWTETWLLWRLARWRRLGDPARLFLEPERFDTRDLAPVLARHTPRIQSLCVRLFAGLDYDNSLAETTTSGNAWVPPIDGTATAARGTETAPTELAAARRNS